ncbi:MAG: hypothetical protein EXS36_19010 [Pedosphaera sp.]|nr:hypothetical protein [Pedosphaera sp.]
MRLWSFGARYVATEANFESTVADVPLFNENSSGVLQQVGLFGLFNYRRGFFARAEGLWNHQHGSNRSTPDPDYVTVPFGDDFWQVNLFAGYRFAQRQAEVEIGLLNLNNADYHLSPVTSFVELPHDRTLVVRIRFEF